MKKARGLWLTDTFTPIDVDVYDLRQEYRNAKATPTLAPLGEILSLWSSDGLAAVADLFGGRVEYPYAFYVADRCIYQCLDPTRRCRAVPPRAGPDSLYGLAVATHKLRPSGLITIGAALDPPEGRSGPRVRKADRKAGMVETRAKLLRVLLKIYRPRETRIFEVGRWLPDAPEPGLPQDEQIEQDQEQTDQHAAHDAASGSPSPRQESSSQVPR